MVDKVKPLKFESSTDGGTENNDVATSTDPTEDYLATKGIAFSNSDSKLIDDANGTGELQYKDPVQTGYKKFNDIVEATTKPRYTIPLLHKGAVGGGTFFGFSEVIPGDTTPIIIPVASNFNGFTFSNNSTLADYTLIFRKNSTVATAFYSISKVNTQYFAETVANELFAVGDQIYIQYQDDGQNAADAVILLTFQAV